MKPVYVSIDLETTGLNPDFDEIIEVGAVKFQEHKIVDTFQTLINPGSPIPYRISLLTGISQRDVNNAPYLFEVKDRLLAFLEDDIVIGHKISFDLDFLKKKDIKLANTSLDTLDMSNILLPAHPEHSLMELARYLGLTDYNPHRALPDAMATRELFLALVGLASRLELPVISELTRLAALINWPLGAIFSELEKQYLINADSGPGIEQEKGSASPKPVQTVTKTAASAVKRDFKPDMDTLAGILEPGGVIAASLQNYEYRLCQVDMLKTIIGAFNNDKHFIIEAGTGTGKSMAYLLPSISFSLENRSPVVISTNTINLQDQLINKDIPALVDILHPDFTIKIAQLKGRANYICPKRYDIYRKRADLNMEKVLFLSMVTVWVNNTATGDRTELNLNNYELNIWNNISAPSEGCLFNKCSYFQQGKCFLHRARQAAEKANLLVINHALLFSDLVSKSKILPEFNHLIVDEAHHLEEVATEQLGFKVSRFELIENLDRLKRIAGKQLAGYGIGYLQEQLKLTNLTDVRRKEIATLLEELSKRIDRIQGLINQFFGNLSRFTFSRTGRRAGADYERHLSITPGLMQLPEWQEVQAEWEKLETVYREMEENLERLYVSLEGLESGSTADYEAHLMEILTAGQFIAAVRDKIASFVVRPENDEVYWLSLQPETDNVNLYMAPLHVGEILQELLFSRKKCIVLTSATLSSSGSFCYIKQRLGLESMSEISLKSPFDYKKSTLLCLPQDVPDIEKTGYQETLQKWLLEMIRAAEGKTLVLFTSHHSLRSTYASLQKSLETENILLIGQGIDGSPRQLLNTFKTTPRTVLFGTSSFWEGVDIVGQALSLLVITRLPFNVPDDPVFAARASTYENSFEDFALPQAILRLKQGFGRLIRSQNDRGVTVIFDPRIQTRAYGLAFLQSLPQCTVKKIRLREASQEIVQWLKQ